MYDSTYLAQAASRSTVFYYKHVTYVNFTAAMVVCISCAILAGFLLHRLKKE